MKICSFLTDMTPQKPLLHWYLPLTLLAMLAYYVGDMVQHMLNRQCSAHASEWACFMTSSSRYSKCPTTESVSVRCSDLQAGSFLKGYYKARHLGLALSSPSGEI